MFNDFFLNILIIGTFLLLTGYIFRRNPSDSGVSENINEFISPENIDLVNSFKENMSNASGIVTIRYRFMKRDGSYISVE